MITAFLGASVVALLAVVMWQAVSRSRLRYEMAALFASMKDLREAYDAEVEWGNNLLKELDRMRDDNG